MANTMPEALVELAGFLDKWTKDVDRIEQESATKEAPSSELEAANREIQFLKKLLNKFEHHYFFLWKRVLALAGTRASHIKYHPSRDEVDKAISTIENKLNQNTRRTHP